MCTALKIIKILCMWEWLYFLCLCCRRMNITVLTSERIKRTSQEQTINVSENKTSLQYLSNTCVSFCARYKEVVPQGMKTDRAATMKVALGRGLGPTEASLNQSYNYFLYEFSIRFNELVSNNTAKFFTASVTGQLH